MYVKIITTDNKIWNQPAVFSDIAYAMSLKKPFFIDFLLEGPDLHSLGFYDVLMSMAQRFQFSTSDITIITANALENHDQIKIDYRPPMHLVDNANKYKGHITKNNNLKHFGIFINRSNAERLRLASYIHKHCLSQSIISYHFNIKDIFHTSNIGLEDLINRHNIQDITDSAEFLRQCPIHSTDSGQVIIDKDLDDNPAQQLLSKDRSHFIKNYQNFFLEIVCESYYTGNTFFPTEKIFRPIVLKTPFIVQGPKYFLHRLRDLGFKTFSDYWDEGYAEDPSDWQLNEIIKLVDHLSKKSSDELYDMYKKMTPILEHNYSVFSNLTEQDYLSISNSTKILS
jgi:hypothetical protein